MYIEEKKKLQSSTLREYLEDQYKDIFDINSINDHIKNYVGFVFSDSIAPFVASQVPNGTILDIGCGFGSFVISARKLGLDAFGIEISPFEVEYARARLCEFFPEANPEQVYLLGDGHTVPFQDNFFDAITLWNVLEHIPDNKILLNEVYRLLKPGGFLFIICPNYAAFRMEAHYIVPWFPLLPKKIGSIYLKLLGRNPNFLNNSIFYTTNWGIQGNLNRLKMEVSRIDGQIPDYENEVNSYISNIKNKILSPEMFENHTTRKIISTLKYLRINSYLLYLVKPVVILKYINLKLRELVCNLPLYNPFINSIVLLAKKNRSYD